MARTKPLKPAQLHHRCDPAQFSFKSTASLKDYTAVLGQQRAVEAIEFGIGIRQDGYNLFAMGPSGSGKHGIVRRYLDKKKRRGREGIYDWCYVFNFDNFHKPEALRLPPGRGEKLRDDMAQLTDDLTAGIRATFESDEYRAKLNEIEQEFTAKEDKPFRQLQARAARRGVALMRTPSGVAITPMDDKGEVLEPEAFEKLSQEEKEKIALTVKALQEELEELIHQAPRSRRRFQQRVNQLNREVTGALVSGLVEEVRRNYTGLKRVLAYIDAVEEDFIDNAEAFRQPEEQPQVPAILLGAAQGPDKADLLKRYQVNVLVDSSRTQECPIVYEDNPTYENLVGSIEHVAELGALLTDFTLIKPGALHSANGGYLVIDADALLRTPYGWEGLKRALRTRHIHTEPLGKRLSLISTVSLEPEPIPLDVKVVMVGERHLYYMLHRYDPDFSQLFKVAADFEDATRRNKRNATDVARILATVARREKMRHFNREGVARIIEASSRQADDSEKLSLRMQPIIDLAREADYHAGKAGKKIVTGEHVHAATEARRRRAGRLPERMRESVTRGTILIETSGERVGQINALAVYSVGGDAFGQPSRITARVRMGSGRVVDIEREVKLGGPLHSKGVLILTSYLVSHFVPDHKVSLRASLVFEQNYGGVDGDSASSTELYALLSALSEVPIRQNLAVTGSVNQFGEVQAIGGVNQKIEGFFDLCKARGLTGNQGVMIPDSNVKHLMLRSDVVAAAAAGKFSIYPVKSIDQGIEILTGKRAGSRGKNGKFPKGTINAMVEERLLEFADKASGKKPNGNGNGNNGDANNNNQPGDKA